MLWIVRSLEKLPLGTDYPPKVADRIRDILLRLARALHQATLRIPETPRGLELRSAICSWSGASSTYPAPSCRGEKRTEHYPDTPKGVYISGGQPVERVSLGKGYAVGRLLGIMDNKRLKAPKSPIWPELRKELMAFELTATSMHDHLRRVTWPA